MATTTVKDVTGKIVERLQSAMDSVATELAGASEQIVSQTRPQAFTANLFWDKFLQKFIAQMISIKLWALAIITGLLITGFVTGGEFAVCFSIVMGAKGIKDVASRLRDTRNLDTIDKV